VISLTLKQKIFLSYIIMISFIIVVGGYAIWSLRELNNISTELIFDDIATAEKITKLNDIVMAQDLYEKRYLTLRSPNAETIFWRRSKPPQCSCGAARPLHKTVYQRIFPDKGTENGRG
jgi:hypothetical protein